MKKVYFFTFLVFFLAPLLIFAQQFELSQEVSVPNNLLRFGDRFAAISGNQAVFGASRGADQGEAYILEKNSENQWELTATLSASDETRSLYFGASVSIAHDRVIVGGFFNAYIFEKQNNEWNKVATIPVSDDDTPAVGISGDYAFIANSGGAVGDDDRAGFVYVYQRSQEGIWSEKQQLVASNKNFNNLFGDNVFVDGEKAMITNSTTEDEFGTNYGYIFELDASGLWQETEKLLSYADFDGTVEPNSAFSKNYVAFSREAYFGSTNVFPGEVKTYKNTSMGWEKTNTFNAPDASNGDFFGSNLALDSNVLLVQTPEKGTYVYSNGADNQWKNDQIIRDYYLADLSGENAIANGPDRSTVYFFTKTEEMPVVVKSFSLVDANTNQVLRPIADGDVIDLSDYKNENFNILVQTEPATIGSVYLELEALDNNGRQFGPKLLIQRTENKVPYAFFGDKSGDYRNWQPEVNDYSLTANPYTKSNKQGISGKPLKVNFKVVQTKPILASSNPYKGETSALKMEFVLVDADNNRVLQVIEEGDVINLKSYTNKNFNILIKAPGSASKGSVVSELRLGNNLLISRIENAIPYAAFGDQRGDFRNWEPELGSYVLKADAFVDDYANFGAGGPVASQEINFRILNEPLAAVAESKTETARLSLYPNPAVYQVNAKVEATQSYQLSVFDKFGQKVYSKTGKGSLEESINLSGKQPGLYMVVLEADGKRESQRLILQ